MRPVSRRVLIDHLDLLEECYEPEAASVKAENGLRQAALAAEGALRDR